MRRAVVLGAVALTGLVAVGIAFALLSRPESVRLVPRSDRDSEARRADWERELARGVREQPDLRFANLSRQEFLRRLNAAAERYDFEVEHVEVLRPKQLAPLVVIRSADPYALTKKVPEIASSLNPKANTGDGRTGWAWEGFYLEARDRKETPAFTIFTSWRRGGGGQWAAAESLYPFQHG